MKLVVVYFTGIILLAGPAFGAKETSLKSPKDKLSYTIGVFSGNNLKQQSIDIDPETMIKGIKDSLSGGKTLLTDQEMREIMAEFQKDMTVKQMEKRKALAEKNKKEGEAFLIENKKKKGVKILPSGLQYKVITEGTGKHPKATDGLVVHYRGTRIDGTEFDSSYQHKEPATFKLDQVIKGWKEALVLMKEGSKWQIFIPANLAYGENGAGPIEPNATLVFDVELIKAYADPSAQVKESKPEKKAPTPEGKALKPATKPAAK